MGFLEGLSRMLQGKPVFVPPQEDQQGQTPPPTQEAAPQPGQQVPPAAAGPKVVPQVTFGRVECRANGQQVQCDCWIRNNSTVQLDLDKITLLGTTRDLGTFLRPGEERRITIYNGNRPQSTGNNNCKLDYKDHTGDWFRAEYWIEFRQQADKTYAIERFRQMPTKDI